MAVGDIISATRYNQLQGKIAALLGIGSGDKGYNQAVSSNPVAVTDTVTVADMNNLHTDFNKVYVHINNTDATTIFRVDTEENITDSLHNAYEILILELEDDRFLLSSAQADIESGGVNSIRNGAAQPWGGTSLPQSINHTVRLTFTSPNARRGFFNAGGLATPFSHAYTGIPFCIAPVQRTGTRPLRAIAWPSDSAFIK